MTDESGANDAPTEAAESESGDGAVDDRGGDDPNSLDDAVGEFLRDVDEAYEDYERGYVDADATLSVVMTHVERLRDARDAE